MSKKFIKGSLEIKNKNITRDYLLKVSQPVINWANTHELDINIGWTQDDVLICQYEFNCMSSQLCKGFVSELKLLLKKHMNCTIITLIEFSGDIIG